MQSDRRCRRLYRELAQKLPEPCDWLANPILDDIREVRNLAIHSYYEKRPATAGGLVPTWKIDKSKGRKYPGSRELKVYCREALKVGEKLDELIPQIKRLLVGET